MTSPGASSLSVPGSLVVTNSAVVTPPSSPKIGSLRRKNRRLSQSTIDRADSPSRGSNVAGKIIKAVHHRFMSSGGNGRKNCNTAHADVPLVKEAGVTYKPIYDPDFRGEDQSVFTSDGQEKVPSTILDYRLPVPKTGSDFMEQVVKAWGPPSREPSVDAESKSLLGPVGDKIRPDTPTGHELPSVSYVVDVPPMEDRLPPVALLEPPAVVPKEPKRRWLFGSRRS